MHLEGLKHSSPGLDHYAQGAGFLGMSEEKLSPAAVGCNCVWVVELCWRALSGALGAKETK